MRDEFSLDDSLIYLNAANLSLCPRRVLDAIQAYREEFERNPTEGLRLAWRQLWTSQQALATFLDCDPDDLFLRVNVTAVLNTFILGVPLPAGSEILVTEHEYGAIVNICRLRARRDGLKLRVLRLPATPAQFQALTREKLIEHVISQLSSDTRLLLMSHVMSGTGLAMPVAEIAKETRKRDVLLAIDGAYAPGAMPLSVAQLEGVDFYGCSLYKWLLGPKGTAFGWVAKDRQHLLAPSSAGWTTFGEESPVCGFSSVGTFANAFLMSGCHDFAPFFGIRDTMAFWETHGARAIFSRMKTLREHLEIAMKSLGWRALTATDTSLRGPLLTYALPERLQSDGPTIPREVLKRCGIQLNSALLRGKWYITLSPHIHNAEQEMAIVAQRLQML